MEVKYNVMNDVRNMGVGLGNFDGLHIGHMKLIDVLIESSKRINCKSMIYTFTLHPENILRKELFTKLITSREKKIKLLEMTELDYIFFEEFNEEFSRLDRENFVKKILVNKLKARLIVAGEDYRFGYGAHGDIEYLKRVSSIYGFDVICVPDVKIKGKKISSSSIRRLIEKGRVETANKLLGRHFSISGSVREGRKIGRKLGFPTANIEFEDSILIPANGIYITMTSIDGIMYKSVTNIGWNPTFDNKKITIETYILDVEGNFYNKEIEINFFKKIRDEIKFCNINDLVNQINKDILKVRKYFETR